jgi:signal transduction histidine kinase
MSTLSTGRPLQIDLTAAPDVASANGHAPAPPTQFSASDLAELMAAFNEVTARLQGTHESLQREVARLREELREANEQLQRSRRLAALGEMAAGIAHEVRNPLGSIRLYARMLEQDLADRPPEQTIAGKIAAAVGGLDAVVGDVLAFSRELRIRPEPADGNELLARALESCWSLEAAEAGIRIVHCGGAEAAVCCDTSLLHQALVNIVRNALEAMGECAPPKGGHELRLQCEADAETFAFRIVDTGPGVSPEVVDRMFNPFFTTRATGTGLGLAIVHRIIDAHRGRIVVSDRGREATGPQGTTFELLLPAIRGTEHQHSTQTQPNATSGREARRTGDKEARS